ncbi:Hypothetical predicted protein [Paramuricea clavata]|uniref:Uncharacterized protein n=1 Tax=Paramuricea clavata TaxID=317549 RepID=A0A6S7JGX8_PARCT|nr:Hypothetical predicted protein [Paramuricea clavata]
MSITRVSDFTKDSFCFEDAVGNRYGSKTIGLTACDQGPLLLKVTDCLSYGVSKNNKFGKENLSISLSLWEKSGFVSVLELIEKECAKHIGKSDEKIMKCLYRKGNTPVLYPGINDETEIYASEGNDPIDPKKYLDKRFHLDAIVRIKGIYISDKTICIQIKLYEGSILEEKPKVPRKRLLRDYVKTLKFIKKIPLNKRMNPATTVIYSAMKIVGRNETEIPNVRLTDREADILYATCAICASSAFSILLFVGSKLVKMCREKEKKKEELPVYPPSA